MTNESELTETRFYDWFYDDYVDDISFYQEIAAASGSPILEVACGTGRVAIPVAERGFEVVGLDHSERMLEDARQKWSRIENGSGSLTLVQGDMREFALDTRFEAVIVPNGSLFALSDPADLKRCAACMYAHTEPGGAIVVDLYSPLRIAKQEIGEPTTLKEKGRNDKTGFVTRVESETKAIEDQFVTVAFSYIEERPSGEHRFDLEHRYRYISEAEAVSLLEEAGCEALQVFGGHDRSRFDEDSERLIVLGRRPA